MSINQQQVIDSISTVNSSTANLTASSSFTGIADSLTGISTIKITFNASQNCTIQVEQSEDGTNWDISDSYTTVASTGDARVFQAIAQYVRVIVTNNGGSTTTFLRLQTDLSPIVQEAPRSLTEAGNYKVAIEESLPAGTNTIGAITQSGTWTTGRTWDLSSSTDSVAAVQSGTWNITNISGTISLPTGASTSALQTTGNTSLASIATNTANLTVAQGSTTSGQTGQLIQGAVTTNPPSYTTGETDPFSLTINGDLRTEDIVNVSGQYRAQSVTETAAEALGGSTILANRKSLTVTPTNGTIYWGYSSSVTTTTGTPIFKNQSVSFAIGSNVHVYVIAAATTDCRMTEGS